MKSPCDGAIGECNFFDECVGFGQVLRTWQRISEHQ